MPDIPQEQLTVHRHDEVLQVEQEQQVQPQHVVQQMPEEQQEHVHLREEDFEVLDLQLENAAPVFTHQGNNLTRQRNAEYVQPVARGKKKSDRKQAAQAAKAVQTNAAKAQEDADSERALELRNRAVALQMDRSPDRVEDNLIAMSRIQEALQTSDHLPPRADVLGLSRRKNEQQYAKGSLLNPVLKRAAQKDVNNLVNNLRRDLCMAEPSYPEDVADILDAYYSAHKFADQVKNAKKAAMGKMKEDSQEYKEATEQFKKLEQMTAFHISISFNTTPRLAELFNNVKARQLARQQILDEGTGYYNMLMVHLLDKEIEAAQAEYNASLRALLTANDSQDTPRGAAQLASRTALAHITRQLKNPDITEEEKAALEAQGRAIFENYNYEGPLDTSQKGADNV